MSNNLISQPLCADCKYFRQFSENDFVCGKYNLKMTPLLRTELKFGCWEEKENIENSDSEIFELKPNFYGIGINIKNLWEFIKDRLK